MKTQTVKIASKLLILTIAPEDVTIFRNQSDETGDVYASIYAYDGFVGYFENDISTEQAVAECLLRSVRTSREATGILDTDGLRAAHQELSAMYSEMAENCAWQAKHRVKVCPTEAIAYRGTSRHGIDTAVVIRSVEAAVLAALPLQA